MVAGEVLTERAWCLKSCYNLQGKYGAIDAVGANVASVDVMVVVGGIVTIVADPPAYN